MKTCRKFISILLAIVFFILSTATVFAEVDNFINADWDKEYELGDVNGDDAVNTQDLVVLRKVLAGLITESDIIADAADLDYSGNIGTNDLVALRKIVAGL